jgi:PilZ domain-containing protein
MWIFDLSSWLTWMHLAMGLGVGCLVFSATGYLAKRRQERATVPDEEDLPWEDLLELLKARYKERASEHLAADELCEALLAQLPPGGVRQRLTLVEEAAQREKFGDRRSSRRRWLNPLAVSFYTPLQADPMHGLVINRSTGGLALLTDCEFTEGTTLFIRSLEAPASVPAAKVQVRHARRAGRMWLIGCQYVGDLPWNVKVWFG